MLKECGGISKGHKEGVPSELGGDLRELCPGSYMEDLFKEDSDRPREMLLTGQVRRELRVESLVSAISVSLVILITGPGLG